MIRDVADRQREDKEDIKELQPGFSKMRKKHLGVTYLGWPLDGYFILCLSVQVVSFDLHDDGDVLAIINVSLLSQVFCFVICFIHRRINHKQRQTRRWQCQYKVDLTRFMK